MNKNNESISVERDALIAEITAAFDGVLREDGITLHEAEEIDCHGTPDELLTARSRDTDTRWQDVRDEWIEEMPCAFAFLNAKGLRYYLPAIMIWELKHGKSSDCAAGDNAESVLRDPSRQESLMPLLTKAQAQATARWLYYMTKGTFWKPGLSK